MTLCLCLYILSLMAILSPLSANHSTATLKSIVSDLHAYQKSPELIQKSSCRRGHEKPFRHARLCLHLAFTAD